MAERLIVPAALFLVALAASTAGQAAYGQGLADPMRPPSVSAEAMSGEAAAPPARLQSILISPVRRVAIIDGRTVAVGDKVGDAVLVAISEADVTLRRGETLEKLKLYPGIERRPIVHKGAGR